MTALHMARWFNLKHLILWIHRYALQACHSAVTQDNEVTTSTAPGAPVADKREVVRSSWFKRARAAAGAMFFLNGMCIANWLSRIPVVRAALDLDDRELGLVLLATAIGSVAAMRFSDMLISHFGSKNLNVAAGCAFAVCLIGPGAAPNPWLLALSLLFVGAASGLMGVCMNTQAVHLERRSGKAILSSFHGLFSLGSMVGAGMGSVASGYDMPLALHLALVAALAVPPIWLAGHFLLADCEIRGQRSKKLTLTRSIIILAVLVFCSSIGEGAMADWTGVYLHETLHTSMTTAALGYSAFATAMLLGRFMGDSLAARLTDGQTLRIGGTLVVLGLGGGLLINTATAMLVGVGFVGLGLATVVPITFRTASRLPDVPTSAALATLASLGYSGFLIGPPLIGIVSHASSLRIGLGVVASLGLPLALLAGTVMRSEHPEASGSDGHHVPVSH